MNKEIQAFLFGGLIMWVILMIPAFIEYKPAIPVAESASLIEEIKSLKADFKTDCKRIEAKQDSLTMWLTEDLPFIDKK